RVAARDPRELPVRGHRNRLVAAPELLTRALVRCLFRPELAPFVEAPAVRGAGGREPAGVEAPRRDRGQERRALDRHGNGAPGEGAIAELAEAVVSPAMQRTGRPEAAGVEPFRRERGETQLGGHGFRRRRDHEVGERPAGEVAALVDRAPAVRYAVFG